MREKKNLRIKGRIARAIITNDEYLSSHFSIKSFPSHLCEDICVQRIYRIKKKEYEFDGYFHIGHSVCLDIARQNPTVTQTFLYLFMRVCIQIN